MTVTVNGATHVDTKNPNELAQLALVASDASYKEPRFTGGEQLAPLDDTPHYGNPPPPFGISFQFVAAGYRVDSTLKLGTDLTGFKAVAFRTTKGEAV